MIDDTFRNIICLSGSFWHEGSVGWIRSFEIPRKTGKAYFLLGDKEAETSVKAFQPVQSATLAIVNCLHHNVIDYHFELVPGNHYQYGEQRLNQAFA